MPARWPTRCRTSGIRPRTFVRRRLRGALGKFHPAESLPDKFPVERKYGPHTELRHQRAAGSGDQSPQISLAPGKRSAMEPGIDLQNRHVRFDVVKERSHFFGAEPRLHERHQLRADVAGSDQRSAGAAQLIPRRNNLIVRVVRRVEQRVERGRVYEYLVSVRVPHRSSKPT